MSGIDRSAIVPILGDVPLVEADGVSVAMTRACSRVPVSLPCPSVLLPVPFEKAPCIVNGRRVDLCQDTSRSFLPLAAGDEIWSGIPSSVTPYLICLFDEQRLGSVAEEVFEAVLPRFEPRLYRDPGGRVRSSVGRLFVEGEEESIPEATFVSRGLSILITADFLRCTLPASSKETAVICPPVSIRRVIAYMEECYAEPLSLDALATEACLSKSRFTVVFKSSVGVTPHDYLRRIRIRAAQRLLRSSADVTRACFSVGFTSLSGFEEAFRAIVGMTPIQYSREMRA